MSPLTALWAASLLGALLFFTSGVLSAEAVQRRLGLKLGLLAGFSPGAPRQLPASPARELPAAEPSTLRGPGEPNAVPPPLPNDSTLAALEHELDEARAHAEDLECRLAESQRTAALVPSLRRRLAEIEHIQASQARTAGQTDERNRTLERELARAREELGRLATQLHSRVDTQTLALEAELRRVNEQQQERTLRIKLLTERVAELEAYADENAALRAERDALRRDVSRLERASRELATPPAAAPRLHVDTAGVATLTRASSQSGTLRRAQDSEDTLEASLRQHLTGLIAREPGLIAVLSDENGFPVAGVGSDQQQENVAVLASLTQVLAFRVKEFVDLERIEWLELADAAGRALRVRFFDWEAQPLALACLGKRSLVANPDEERVVRAFPQLLTRAWSA